MDDSIITVEPVKKKDAKIILSKDFIKQTDEKRRIPKHFENGDTLSEIMFLKGSTKTTILKQ